MAPTKRAIEHEITDLSAQRLASFFVVAEMLPREDTAGRSLVGRL
jgi:hypothetical protein